tara:strand:+ start:860 stop:1138 length:279 start_codon:yes stop_codon:yes gene_type:complete
MDDESFRIIANPYRLVKDCVVTKDEDIKKPSFKDGLRSIVEREYNDIYINPLIHRKIYEEVTQILNEYLIDKIVEDELDCIIESSLTHVSTL